jgi:hypothetical protein
VKRKAEWGELPLELAQSRRTRHTQPSLHVKQVTSKLTDFLYRVVVLYLDPLPESIELIISEDSNIRNQR